MTVVVAIGVVIVRWREMSCVHLLILYVHGSEYRRYRGISLATTSRLKSDWAVLLSLRERKTKINTANLFFFDMALITQKANLPVFLS